MLRRKAGSVTAAAASTPFVHLANDMSYDCIRSATDRDVTRSTVYLRCIAAKNALLNAKTPQPYADDDAVTASILEIYAAYAIRQSSPTSAAQYYAMLDDAHKRLTELAASGSSTQIRERAIAAKSCLIERDAGCLKYWARYQ